jgi:hypothetical protein
MDYFQRRINFHSLWAFSRDRKIKLGFSITPELRRQTERETLDLLPATYFPDSVVSQKLVACAASRYAKRCDWEVADDGVFPVVLEQEQEAVIPYLVRTFRVCLVC